MLAHRKILAGAKDVVAKAMDRFVVLRAGAERKGVAVAALVLELPDLVALTLPKPVHRADIGIAGKRRAIEAPVLAERQGEGIAMRVLPSGNSWLRASSTRIRVKVTSGILHWCRVRMRIVHSNTHPSDEMP